MRNAKCESHWPLVLFWSRLARVPVHHLHSTPFHSIPSHSHLWLLSQPKSKFTKNNLVSRVSSQVPADYANRCISTLNLTLLMHRRTKQAKPNQNKPKPTLTLLPNRSCGLTGPAMLDLTRLDSLLTLLLYTSLHCHRCVSCICIHKKVAFLLHMPHSHAHFAACHACFAPIPTFLSVPCSMQPCINAPDPPNCNFVCSC